MLPLLVERVEWMQAHGDIYLCFQNVHKEIHDEIHILVLAEQGEVLFQLKGQLVLCGLIANDCILRELHKQCQCVLVHI